MSCYSAFEVTIPDIKIDEVGINELKNIREGHLSDYESITSVYKEDFVRFYKVFNYKPEDVFSTLKIVEKYLIKSDEVKEIGSTWDENAIELEGKIYTYNGKIYIVYIKYTPNWGFPDDYQYTVINTDDLVYTYDLTEETKLNIIFSNYETIIAIKYIVSEECNKQVFHFVNEIMKN